MYFSLVYLSYFLVFFSCNNKANNNQKLVNSDTIFINWNKSTLQSLNNHIELAKDSSEKNLYRNRLLAFKAFVDINSEEEVNANSLRYQFLKELIKNTNSKKDFYIIEANRSGEKMEIRNYVVYIETANMVDVDVYNFANGKWVRNAVSEKLSLHLDSNLKSYITKFRLGFNQDDVVITLFNNNAGISSEYYLYTTLSDVSNIKKIFSLQ